jgi:exodeoxyribonuclease VII large subunit
MSLPPVEETSASSERRVFTVSEITRQIKQALENGFPDVWIEGEISNLKRHDSGHLYFSLKDGEAQIGCVMWRGRNAALFFSPRDGMQALVRGSVAVYERQGRYQLDVAWMRPSGVGSLAAAFDALKRRLFDEGLFDSERKKPLPDFPERIAVVTSPTGAVIRDMLNVLGRRFPSVEVILYPVRVQGGGAAEDLADAVRDINRHEAADVIVLARGGGSLEDLWAFNEEILARAIFDSAIPVVSAVGHEVDFTIADFVADLRAPTPSAAAELLVPDRIELGGRIQTLARRMAGALAERIARERIRVQTFLKGRTLSNPDDWINQRRMRVDEASRNLRTFYGFIAERARLRWKTMDARLFALDPQTVLRRGYSITRRVSDGRILISAADLRGSEAVTIRFAEGAAAGTIAAVIENQDNE